MMFRCNRIISGIALLTLLISPWIGGQHALAGTNQAPEGAKKFAETYFHKIVEETVFSDQPGDWGFKEEEGSISFSELYPIYTLNADFAFGHSDEIITDQQPKWAAVIFQDNQPVNAIGVQLARDGQYELAQIGYPPELPYGLLNLKEHEIIIHDFLADEYYVYSEKTNQLSKLGQLNGKHSLSSSLTKESFQKMLLERYQDKDRWAKDSSGGVIISIACVLAILTGVWFYYRKRPKVEH